MLVWTPSNPIEGRKIKKELDATEMFFLAAIGCVTLLAGPCSVLM